MRPTRFAAVSLARRGAHELSPFHGKARCVDKLHREAEALVGSAPRENLMADPDSVVYVVDDDASVRAGLESLLRSAGWAVQCFASGFDFLSRPASNSLACLVLDVHLPEGSGLELQRELASREPLPIVFITGYGDISMSVRAIKAGAIEFLPKPFRDQELLEAVEQALLKARANWDARQQLLTLQARFESLTPRERQVLDHVVAGKLNKQIASALGISEVTVKEHRGHVMQKLRATSIAELVRMAVRVGIEPEAAQASPTKVWCSPPTDDTSLLRGARTKAGRRRCKLTIDNPSRSIASRLGQPRSGRVALRLRTCNGSSSNQSSSPISMRGQPSWNAQLESLAVMQDCGMSCSGLGGSPRLIQRCW